MCDQTLSHIRNTATSLIYFGIFLLSLFLNRMLVLKIWLELASMVEMNKWHNFCIVANMIRWYCYSLKSENLNVCIGNDFFFHFEMLEISVMLFLSLCCLDEVTKVLFVMCWFLILILLLFVCLTPFVICLVHIFFKRKDAAKDMKRFRFGDVGNGRLVDFSYFCKNDLLIALAHA